ncbi:hypothetical protein PM082_011729 [Marasmius tenuissimus]|nr:hypothetical protein PM082_011729 [Marasmius tenuissimus]
MSTTSPDQPAWTPPQFDTSKPPELRENLPSLGSRSNFVRIAKWCPDGSTVLTQREDRSYRMVHFPSLDDSLPAGAQSSPPQSLTLQQPAPIVDFLWYPTASPKDPASFCFVSSVRDSPVKLLDASNGRLRASYPIIDHVERFIAPHSLAFNPYGTRLYCGFENAIEVFDVGQPGEGTRLMTTPNKKSKDGLKGIVSALAFCPSYTTDWFAAGSLAPTSSNVAIYSETQGEVPVMFLGNESKAGVTQLMFNPMRPHLLYASFRRRTEVACWDLRSNANIPWKLYSPPSATPEELTNQKRRFDVDIGGRWLSVGSQDGSISLFDLDEEDNTQQRHYEEPLGVLPTLGFKAHEDSVTTAAFRPTSSDMVSTSGSRCFEGDSSDEEEDDVNVKATKKQPIVRDGSIRLWRFS